ncbi:MAG TPA: hypothetical protein VM286_09610 [Candidatus Thermoplasmatota archaeon]|nr:hypothetical protein [Candidatus Thermoplasmatota archaeon]
MGLLKDFGSRNHPRTRGMQKARAGMAVSEETVAQYTAARGFLMAEWFGASVMVASFTLLYLLTFGSRATTRTILAVCLAILLLGAYVFWTNHRNYTRVGFLWAKRWDNGAIVTAGSAVIFWFLFAMLEVLTLFGVSVGPK